MAVHSKIGRAVLGAARIALIILITTMAMGLLRWGLDLLFGEKVEFNWRLSLEISLFVSGLWFAVFFLWILIAASRDRPAIEIFDEEPLPSELAKERLAGFVAMEYFWLILNRTYVVFIAPDGLRGWKVRGPVTNLDKSYYEPYQEMLKDDELMRDRRAIEKLSQLRGGFFIERSAIVSVEYDERQKWGMGGIPHSGRIYIGLANGKKREFILLGFAIGDELNDRIGTTLGIAASNQVKV